MIINPYNAYQTALKQFNKAADILELNQATKEFLSIPAKEIHFTIPVRMDDGKKKIFNAFRIIHNNARGPAKGGVRFHPMETVDTIRALSMWMTWKSAVADIPIGGSNGGVICDPHNLSQYEQEQICRGYIRQIIDNLGPCKDVPTPDIMTNPHHMIWMLDEYEKLKSGKFPGAVTGKPIEYGGSQGRIEANGYGTIITVREALKELNINPENTTASVQGFGNVAKNAVDLYQKIGGKVICVSAWDNEDQKSYAFRKKEGINLDELKNISDPFGGIDKSKAQDLGYELLEGEKWIEQEVDILIPAAVENQINEQNAKLINEKVKLIAEGANGPTTTEADEMINEKGIMIIPDLLANSGGIICDYFEQVQNNMNYYWSKDEVLSKLDVKLTDAYTNVSDFAIINKLKLRDAAYFISVDRVAKACEARGWV